MHIRRTVGAFTALALVAGWLIAAAFHASPISADTGDWSAFRRGNERSGFNSEAGTLALPMNVRWSVSIPDGGQGFVSPIAAFGKLIVGTIDGNVLALDPATGATQWTRSTEIGRAHV